MEYELIRQLVLEELRNQLKKLETGRDQGHLNVRDVLFRVAHIASIRQLWAPAELPPRIEYVGEMLPGEDGDTIRDILWQLTIQGVLVPGVQGNVQTSWPSFYITKYGKSYLETEGSAPYDPDGYLSCIKNDSPNVDDVVLLYLTEGLQCFIRSNYIASVVMVGVAAEKVILNLIDAFASAMSDASKATTFRRKIQNAMLEHSLTS